VVNALESPFGESPVIRNVLIDAASRRVVWDVEG